MDRLQSAIAKIERQQGSRRGTMWIVGEQLKGILLEEPKMAELVDDDLDNKKQSLAAVEKKIKQFAMSHGGAASGAEAEDIIREVYGLPKKKAVSMEVTKQMAETVALEDFF